MERTAEKPSLLVLSNVPSNSTNVKLEKLRDILESYSSVPRIVVTTGEDPITFFNQKLFLPLNYACYLTTSLVKKTIEL